MKYWKQRQKSAERRLQKADYDIGNFSAYKRYCSVWGSPSDGKWYIEKDNDYREKCMRK